MSRFMPVGDVHAFTGRILDCRFDLMDPEAGVRAFTQGHLPGAHHLDLEGDLSAEKRPHGGRHPLPEPRAFAQTLADHGIDKTSEVLLYDDSRGLFAARAWWMLRALGYREPRLLAGGYSAWLAAGGDPEEAVSQVEAIDPPSVPDAWPGRCARDDLAGLQADGARLVDAREAPRYRGDVEPIDPVAGHIPGAENRPWKDFIADDGALKDPEALAAVWGDLLDGAPLVVYCGSGVSACVNLLALAELDREATLYAGSWSDYCSYL